LDTIQDLLLLCTLVQSIVVDLRSDNNFRNSFYIFYSFIVVLTVAVCSIFYQQQQNLIPPTARNRYIHEIQYGWSFHAAIVTIILVIASFLMQLFSCVYWKDKEVKEIEFSNF